jgi:micrococcal nuclease
MKIILLLIILVLTSGCISEQARAKEVIDGDTFILDNGDRVRLIGINTPEIGDYYSEEATNRLSQLVMHKSLRLERDIRDRDDYGRLLRYVYTDEHFVNLMLLQEGYAELYLIAPDSKYNKEFEKANYFAKNNHLGLFN